MRHKDYIFCSRGEVFERARICDVHLLEATSESADSRLPLSLRVIDPSRAVKKFTRSGSSDLHKTYEPRSFPQLQATVQYLLRDIWWQSTSQFIDGRNRHPSGKSGSDVSSAYTFVMDRLQAVRQDIISLNMFLSNPTDVIKLLKDIIIFYINSMYLITSDYDRIVGCPTSTQGIRKQRKGTPIYGSSSSDVVSQTGMIDNNANNSTSSVPSTKLSSWFDLHSHESALFSIITTSLSFCHQLPAEHKDSKGGFDVLAYFEELSAYSMLLSTARQLRNIFQYVHSGSSDTSTRSGKVNAIAAMRLLCVQQPTIGTTAVNTLLELYESTTGKLRYNMIGSASCKQEEYFISNAGTSTLVSIALRCVSCIRQSNPEGAVRAFSSSAAVSAFTAGSDACSIKTVAETSDCTRRLVMAALMHHMLPELRLCRLMLCDLSDKKNGVIDLACLERRLWLSPLPQDVRGTAKVRADMIDVCRLLDIPVKFAVNSIEDDQATLKSLPSDATISQQVHMLGQGSVGKKQIDADASLRYRSTFMGCGAASYPLFDPPFCLADDAAMEMSSGPAGSSSYRQMSAGPTLLDWEDRAEVGIESTLRNPSSLNAYTDFADVVGLDDTVVAPLNEANAAPGEVQCLGSNLPLGARDIIVSFRDILHHSSVDDWLGCPNVH